MIGKVFRCRAAVPALVLAVLLEVGGPASPAKAVQLSNDALGSFDSSNPAANPYAGCIAATMVGNGFVFPTLATLTGVLGTVWPVIPAGIALACKNAVGGGQPQVCLVPGDPTLCPAPGAATDQSWVTQLQGVSGWELAADGMGVAGGYAQVGLPRGAPSGTPVGSVSGTFTTPSYVCTSPLSCPAPSPGLYSDCGPFSCGPVTWFTVTLTGRTPDIAGFPNGEPAWGGYVKAVDGYGHVVYNGSGVYGNWYWGGGCGGPEPHECGLTWAFRWNCMDASGNTGANCADQSLTVTFTPYSGFRDGNGDAPSAATLAQQVRVDLAADNLSWHPNGDRCGLPVYYNFGAPNDCLNWNDPRLSYLNADGTPAVVDDRQAPVPGAVMTVPSSQLSCLVGVDVFSTPAASCPDANGNPGQIVQPPQALQPPPQPVGQRPLIFVPGIMGTYLRNAAGQIVWISTSTITQPSLLYDAELASDGVSDAPNGPGLLQPQNGPSTVATGHDDLHGALGTVTVSANLPVFGTFTTSTPVYDPLAQEVTSSGVYTMGDPAAPSAGANFYIFPTDWRRSAVYNASYLETLIASVIQKTGFSQVDVFAHSQGGLVTEALVHDPRSVGQIAHLVTAGTPYLGAPKLDGILLYRAACPLDAVIGICPLDKSVIQTAMRNFTGALELAPSATYWKVMAPDANKSPIRIDHNFLQQWQSPSDVRNLFQSTGQNVSLYDQVQSWHAAVDGTPPLDPELTVVRVVGDQTQTLDTLRVWDQTYLLCNWIDVAGRAVCIPQIVSRNGTDWLYGDGDGTVPLHSADLVPSGTSVPDGSMYSGGINCHVAGVNHSGLSQSPAVIQAVLGFFAGGGSFGCPGSAAGALSAAAGVQYRAAFSDSYGFTDIHVDGPLSGAVTDSAGRRTGSLDPSVPSEVIQIPGSDFNSSDSSASYVVPDRASVGGRWVATSGGEIAFRLRDYRDGVLTAQTAAPRFLVEQGATISLAYSGPGGQPVLQVADSGGTTRTIPFGPILTGSAATDLTAPSTTATVTPAANPAGWNNSDVTISLAATDDPGGSGVASIQYLLSGAQTSDYTTVEGSSATLTIHSAGTTTVNFSATDAAGNAEPYQTLTIKLDKTPPSVSCPVPDGSWHPTNVTLGCTASDAISGLADSTQALINLGTSVPAGVETSNAVTGSVQVCDVAGNCAQAGPIGGNQVDRKPPVITLTTPSPGAAYLVHQPVTVAYSCSDGGSGVAGCAGTLLPGAALVTDAPGAYTFSIQATDKVGNASTAAATYDVTYGICPKFDEDHAIAAGAAIPIRIEVCDAQGVDLSSAAIQVTGLRVIDDASGADVEAASAKGDANPGGAFRLTGQDYQYDLDTTGLATGTYDLTFAVSGDVLIHKVRFSIR